MLNQNLTSHYETIAPLGRGGMGEVFLAAMPGPPGLNQLAVVKRIWPELAHEPEFVAMFLDEARLALRMRHRNIVQTFEVGREASQNTRPGAGSDPERYFIAMEYLAGQTLAQVAARLADSNAFGLQLRLQIIVEVLNALEYAHDLRRPDGTPLGVVHRDISPQNVFITYAGKVKLMDFGVAKSLGAAHQTRPGTFKGRFAYTAPEQIRGTKVDRRSDLFSVGIILWELLTEQRMFRGRTKVDIARILAGHERLPPLPADWPIPERLRFVTARALALQPNARYQTAAAFRQDLLDVQTNWLPPDPRSLGKVVACAFQTERESIESTIERYFQVNDEALTRVPFKPRKTQSQVSMPVLWPQGASSQVPPPGLSDPLRGDAPGSGRSTPRSGHPVEPSRGEAGGDRVPYLESAVVSLMPETWYSRFIPDTLIDGVTPTARRFWRRLQRSRLAFGAAGLCVGALSGLILMQPSVGSSATAAPAAKSTMAISRISAGSADTITNTDTINVAPAAEPPDEPTAPLPQPELVAWQTPASRAAKPLPVAPAGNPARVNKPRPARAGRSDAQKLALNSASKEAGGNSPGESPEMPPGRALQPPAVKPPHPTLDTENPWGQ